MVIFYSYVNVYQRVNGRLSIDTFEKYEFVNGKDDIPYTKWKIKHV